MVKRSPTHSRNASGLLRTTHVSASPVLLEATRSAGVSIDDLVEFVVAWHGHAVVSPSTSTGRRLLGSLPQGATISAYRQTLDLAFPVGSGEWTCHYCEADTFPFVQVTEPKLTPAAVAALGGRRVSCLGALPFEALRTVDPVIADASVVFYGANAALSVHLDMDWVDVPTRPAMRLVDE